MLCTWWSMLSLLSNSMLYFSQALQTKTDDAVRCTDAFKEVGMHSEAEEASPAEQACCKATGWTHTLS